MRSGILFAGGRATRLGGRNKALLEIGGRPIVARILAALTPVVDELLAVVNDDSLDQIPSLRTVRDPDPHAGVLPALRRGLEAARGELCLAVACDMPFVSRAVFEYLLQRQADEDLDVVIPRQAEYLEPMHAVYRRDAVLAAIRDALAAGERRMISYFSRVRVGEVDEAEWRRVEPSGEPFFNVNTADDLATARRLASSLR